MQPKKCVNNWCSLKDNSFTKKALIFSPWVWPWSKKPTSLFRLLPLFFGSGKTTKLQSVNLCTYAEKNAATWALKLNESLVGVTKLRKNMLFQRFVFIFFGIHPEMEVVYGGRTSQRAFFSNYEIYKIRISYITYIFCDCFCWNPWNVELEHPQVLSG